MVAVVVGLTPATGRATQPPEIATPESSPKPQPQPKPAGAGMLTIATTAVSIVVRAAALEREQPVIELGSPPISAELPAGRYRIEAEGPGYEPWSREVEILPGEALTLSVEPELIGGARLILRAGDEASVGASVSLDGARVCELPCDVEIEPGQHQVEISKRRTKGLAFPIDVTQADEVVLDVTLEPATSRAPAIVTGAVALTSLGVALGYSIHAEATRRSLAADLESLAQYDADDRRIVHGRRDVVIASSLYGAAAVAGALTLYYLLRQPGRRSRADKRKRNLALVPSFGPRGAGLFGVVAF